MLCRITRLLWWPIAAARCPATPQAYVMLVLFVLTTSAVPSLPQVDMRAEVAVLSRNVVIQGDEDSAATLFGAQLLVNTPRGLPRAQLQLDNVELRRTGQAFKLARWVAVYLWCLWCLSEVVGCQWPEGGPVW
jgi:hypothetical protein